MLSLIFNPKTTPSPQFKKEDSCESTYRGRVISIPSRRRANSEERVQKGIDYRLPSLSIPFDRQAMNNFVHKPKKNGCTTDQLNFKSKKIKHHSKMPPEACETVIAKNCRVFRHSLGDTLGSSTPDINLKPNEKLQGLSSNQKILAESNASKKDYDIALELINLHLNSNTEEKQSASILSHCWYISTEYFLQILIEEALRQDRKEKTTKLLKMANELIANFQFYPMSSRYLVSIYDKCKGIPTHFEEEKSMLMLTICRSLQGIELSQYFPIPSATNEKMFSRASQSHFSKISTSAQQPILQKFEVVCEAIGRNAVDQESISQIAFDFKKLEARLFTQILPKEFVPKKISHSSQNKASHIKDYLNFKNLLNFFLINHILTYRSEESRASCCNFYILLMKKSLEIGNYSTAFSIHSALQNLAIARLKLTWERIDRNAMVNLHEIETIFLVNHNFKNYFNHLEQREKGLKNINAQNCTIPIFSFYARDLTSFQENLAYVGHLDAKKISLPAAQHASLQRYQRHLLNFKDELITNDYCYDIYEWIYNKNSMACSLENIKASLDNLYPISLELEPS